MTQASTEPDVADLIGHYVPGLIPVASDIGDGSWAKAFDEHVAALAALRQHGEHDAAYHETRPRATGLVAALNDQQVDVLLYAIVVDRVNDQVMSYLINEGEESSYTAVAEAAAIVWRTLVKQDPTAKERRDTLAYRIANELYEWAGRVARSPGEPWNKLWMPPPPSRPVDNPGQARFAVGDHVGHFVVTDVKFVPHNDGERGQWWYRCRDEGPDHPLNTGPGERDVLMPEHGLDEIADNSHQ